MMMLDEATHVRLGSVIDVWRLTALGGRIIATGSELHTLMLDEEGRDLAPEQRAAMRWTLVRLGNRTRILVVQEAA